MPVDRKRRDDLIDLLTEIIRDLQRNTKLPTLTPDDLSAAAEECENLIAREEE